MKVETECRILEMTNGFLDNLSFLIECDITVYDGDTAINIPFDSDTHKILVEDSNLSKKLKQKLSGNHVFNQLVFDVIFKTIHKLDVTYSETKDIQL